jgi:ElaB/YqjD/DUF883 family membrane-anchored ribosome-binding protein
MARTDERSLEDLRRGAERTRAEFVGTVDQLRSKMTDTVTDFQERISPAAVKAQVSDYVHTRADALVDKARQNPLQAAAIGLGLAYPLMGVIRSIPAPVLMIGAGLYLLGSNSGQRAVEKAATVTRGLSDQIGGGVESVAATYHAAQEGLASAGRSVSSAIASATTTKDDSSLPQGAEALQDGMQRIAASSGAVAAGALAELQAKAGASLDAATSATVAGAAAANTAVREAAGTMGDLATDTARNAADGYQRAATVVVDAIRQNPFLTGGIAFAIGALVASALPRSDIERTVLGDVSADAAKQADDVLSKGFDAAKDAAVSLYRDVAQKASDEGLTANDLQDAGDELGRRVRRVAQTATSAAFDTSSFKPKPTDKA